MVNSYGVCPECDQRSLMSGDNGEWCCNPNCGYGDEDISAIQSEMAKGYSNYIRRTAPWIIGGDE